MSKMASGIILTFLLVNIGIVFSANGLTPTTQQVFPGWDVLYSADNLPNESDPSWWLIESFSDDSGIVTLSDGILVLNTVSEDQVWTYGRGWNADNSIGTTVEVRLKVDPEELEEGGVSVSIYDGTFYQIVQVYKDRLRFWRPSLDIYYFETTDDFHVYRFLIKGNSFKVFIDEYLATEMILDKTETYSGIWWGDYVGGWKSRGKAYWDYVAYTTKGAFEPLPMNPLEALEKLIEAIEKWNLPRGTENSLAAKLEGAIHLLGIGNENGAIHKLMDFINQAEAQRSKKLSDNQADYLTAEAQRILNLIEG